MTYVITGLRRLLAGGDLGPVWTACAVLAGITVVSLALTWLTAARGKDQTATVVPAPDDDPDDSDDSDGDGPDDPDDSGPDDDEPVRELVTVAVPADRG